MAAKKAAVNLPKLVQNWKNSQDPQKQEELQLRLNLKQAEGSARADLTKAETLLIEHEQKLLGFESIVRECENAVGKSFSSAALLNARRSLQDAKDELKEYELAVSDLKAINKEMLGI